MRKTLILASSALAVCFATPAAAQVMGGNVSGNAGVRVDRPDVGLGQTVRDTRDFTRDTVRSTRDGLPEARVDGRASAEASARPRRISTQTDVAMGTEVRARNGDLIGSVVGTTRDARGYVQTVLVRTADGAVRSLPAASADLAAETNGEVVISRWDRRRVERQRPVDDRMEGDHQRTVE